MIGLSFISYNSFCVKIHLKIQSVFYKGFSVRLLKILGLLIFLLDCGQSKAPSGDTNDPIESGEALSVLESLTEDFSGDKCSEEAEHDCKEHCAKMYDRQKIRRDCEDLSIEQIQNLFDLYDLLTKPREENLKEMLDFEAFTLFLKVSVEGMDELLEDYSSNEAEEFLLWLIQSDKAVRLFAKEDHDFKMLGTLLQSLEKFNYEQVYEPFVEKINSDPLMELAIESSDFVVEWFHDFINKKNKYCDDDPDTRECFAIYCRIGKDMDEDSRTDWMSIDIMKDYIEEIIGNKVNSRQGVGKDQRNSKGWIHENAAGFSYEQIGDIDDIENWVDDLCHNLKEGSV